MTIEQKYQQRCATVSDIFQHLPTLRKYAAQCRTVTELGVRGIVSTWALLAGLGDFKRQSKDMIHRVRLIAVDMFHPKDAGGDLDEVKRLAADEEIEFEFCLADDREIALPLMDLLFIDTYHIYEQLKAELDRHAAKAMKFIILHDTTTYGERGEAEGHRGLKAALDEFFTTEEGRHWFVLEEYTNCNGLMVLERRK